MYVREELAVDLVCVQWAGGGGSRDLFSFRHDLFYFGDHPFHHALDTGLERDHRRGAARAGALQHQVYHAFVITFELYGATIHFNGGLHIAFEQFFYALDHVIVVRVDQCCPRNGRSPRLLRL